MGDIGEEIIEIELIPLGEPEDAPLKEPSPSLPPKTAPTKKPVPVPVPA
jgi:hypothetical protein